ncbi:MAG TPA: hypothetical protein VMX74_13515 [Pirellulales bacterium]|nr:hypothetical protein [Pirellulales bacterium]
MFEALRMSRGAEMLKALSDGRENAKMSLSDARHPIYGILKGFIAVLVLFVILYFSAENYDETEIETIGWFGAIYALIQGGHEVLKRGSAS